MIFKEVIRCLLWESYETRKYTVWENEDLLNIKSDGIYNYHFA